MKKILLIIFILFLTINSAYSFDTDYAEIYRSLEMPDFSYIHDIDPKQYYDNMNASYSVYPLFRLCSPLYFKSITIIPGYYDLTPREHDGKEYILFKYQGLVKYIIPAYKKELVPEGFYETHLPKQKKVWYQKFRDGFYKFIGDH